MVITLLNSNVQYATKKHKAYKEKKYDPLKKYQQKLSLKRPKGRSPRQRL